MWLGSRIFFSSWQAYVCRRTACAHIMQVYLTVQNQKDPCLFVEHFFVCVHRSWSRKTPKRNTCMLCSSPFTSRVCACFHMFLHRSPVCTSLHKLTLQCRGGRLRKWKSKNRSCPKDQSRRRSQSVCVYECYFFDHEIMCVHVAANPSCSENWPGRRIQSVKVFQSCDSIYIYIYIYTYMCVYTYTFVCLHWLLFCVTAKTQPCQG
jgi:hypothetical protein